MFQNKDLIVWDWCNDWHFYYQVNIISNTQRFNFIPLTMLWYIFMKVLFKWYVGGRVNYLFFFGQTQGGIQGGGAHPAHPARAPPKIGKNMIFLA